MSVHRAMATNCQTYGTALQMNEKSRVLQFAAHTFDASIFDMFAALLLGGCVCIPSEEDRMNDLAGFIERTRCNWVLATSTVMSMITPQQVPSLEVLVLGGEPLSRTVLEEWAPFAVVFNAYGPAESAIMSTCSPRLTADSKPSLIGKAMTGPVWITSTSDHDKLMPVGCIGEISVQGPGVSRGYLNAPEKTSEVFFDKPTWSHASFEPYSKLYRTGDLGRLNSDGFVEILGRKDNQVKLRGQRLELGEVEYQIASHAQVKQCTVVKGYKGLCKERLVGVVSLHGETKPLDAEIHFAEDDCGTATAQVVSEIRQKLADALPVYMIPTLWAVLQELPITTSGKVYTKGLQQWVDEMSPDAFIRVSRSFMEARNEEEEESKKKMSETEQKIQKVWARVLNLPIDAIARSSTFLSVGGDSVSAMRVMSLCRAEKLLVTVQDVLRDQTLASLAACVKTIGSSTISNHLEEIYDTPVQVSPIQDLFFATQGASNRWNQSFMLELRKPISLDRLRAALDALVKRHSMLRARFQKSSAGKWMQQVAKPNDDVVHQSFTFDTVGISDDDSLEKHANMVQDRLNIEDGPVFTATLVSRGENQYLYMVAHHLVIDLVSWRIIIQDLEDTLSGIALSNTLATPYLQLTKERAAKSGGNVKDQDPTRHMHPNVDWSYWDFTENLNLEQDSRQLGFSLDKRVSDLILGACNNTLRTEPTDLFVAAILNSFAEVFTDRDVPAVFVEGHGRDHEAFHEMDATGTVGWFTAIWPLSVPITWAGQHVDLMQTIRATKDTRRRQEGLGKGFLDNTMAQSPSQDLSMEVIFNYEGQYQQLESSDGLFRMLPLPAPDFADDVTRMALFEITTAVKGGQVVFDFLFNSKSGRQDQIGEWVKKVELSLAKLAAEASAMAKMYSLSDFPLLPLDYDNLATFITGLESRLAPLRPRDSPFEIEEAYPCTGIQEGLLLAQGKNSGSYAVHETLEVVSAAGTPIDVLRLREAWMQVVNRHPVLRTVFVDHPTSTGYHVQVVLPRVVPEVNISTSQSVDEALVLWKGLGKNDYPSGQLLHRFNVCSTAGGRALIRFDFSHCILDAQSCHILFRDLSQAYAEGLDLNRRVPRFSQVLQYMQGRGQSSDLAFWEGELRGAEPCCLPNLSDSLDENVLEIQPLELGISADTVHAFCKQHSVSPFAILQVAWARVLSAYTSMERVSFGYLTSGRNAPIDGIEDIAGVLVNMLVAHTKVDYGLAAIDAVKAMHNSLTESLDHQYCSLTEVQHALELGGQPLFNTVLDFQRTPEEEHSPAAISLRPLEFHDPTEFALTLHFELNQKSFSACMAHWTSALSPSYAKNIGEALVLALQTIVAQPDIKVGSIDLIGNETLQKYIDINTPAPVAKSECLHNTFRRRVQMMPTAPAVFSTDMSLTYAELDLLSTKLANELLRMDVGPETNVVLCFEKSAWTIVSIMAVWKAGGCVVALDPSHPESRLKGIAEDVAARIALVSPATIEKCRDSLDPQIRFIVVDSMNMGAMIDERPNVTSVQPHNAAYINFTSGTTGKPKGVVIEHQAIASNVEPLTKAADINNMTRVLQFSSYAWDAFYCETIMPLMSGGCICVANDSERSYDTAEFIRRANCTWALFTPSFARLLTPSDVPNLRTLLLGGEAMSADDVATWSGSVVLKNAYGPCECSIVALMHPRIDMARSGSNLGHRLGQTLWVVDPRNPQRLAPVGSPGELLLGGPPVARGYINDPSKTAAAFISNPAWFTSNSVLSQQGFTSRFYCTGDLVRLNADGTLNFLGRKDGDQVKLRGQRMELGEVEQCIMTNMSTLKQVAAAVISRSGQDGDRQLVAFINTSDSTDLTSKPQTLPMSDDLLKSLQALAATMVTKVPSFMIPSMFIPVNRIPLSASTKIDRKALTDLACHIPESSVARYALTGLSEACPPTTPIELTLHGLFATSLGVGPASLSIADNFFHRGGDSIKAIRLVAAARHANVHMTVVDVFNHPTVQELANVATFINTQPDNPTRDDSHDLFVKEMKAEVTNVAVKSHKMKAGQIQDMYPCTELQDAMLSITLGQPGAYVLQMVTSISEDADIEAYIDAWKAVRRNNDILRTRIVSALGKRYQVVYNDRMDIKSGESLQEYLASDKKKPIAYGDALARFALIAEEDKQYLVCTMHHSIYDGWSVSLIMDQLSQAYQWKPLQKPPPFSEYAWHVYDQDRVAAERFWSAELAGATTCDYPHLPSPTYQADARFNTARIMNFQQGQSDVPMAAIIKSAWALLLGQYTGTRDVVFATTNAGRNLALPGIADMIGPTIATVPVRVRFDSAERVKEMASKVHQGSLSMVPYEYLGLQNIRHLDASCEAACQLRSLLVVQPGDLDDADMLAIPGVDNVPVDTGNFFTQPLVLECTLGGDKVKLSATYDDHVLSSAEVERLLAQLEHFIRQLCMDMDRTVGDMDLVCPEDKLDLSSWNAEEPPKINMCVWDLVAQRTQETPLALAISSWDGEMTYEDLDKHATRLAAHLCYSFGVRGETLVPLAFEKSAWAIVAMLAVVKSGGAFVFLDDKLPAARQRFVVSSTRSRFVLSSAKNLVNWDHTQWRSVEVSREAIGQLPDQVAPTPSYQPDSMLYAIYTSGSTGTPKGCVVEHAAFLSSAASYTKLLQMGPDTRALLFSSFAFDVSLMESLAVLTVGGCICIASEQAYEAGVASMIQEAQPNWASLTPSVARLVDPSDVPSLKTLALVGEPLSQEDVRTWAANLQLMNGYGPTECAVLCLINANVTPETKATNTGFGSGGLTWVVDPNNADILMPIGCPGELLMQGPILARGYLDLPEETTSAFVAGLKWAPQVRFYKTGDIVRYSPDGSIQCFGRKDQQVKVRGQRVELGEIEENIDTLGSVSQSCVVFPKSGTFQKKVVAVVVLEEFASRDDAPLQLISATQQKFAGILVNQMRDALSENLPSYMVPEAWILVTALSISLSGKRDRSAIARWVTEIDPKQQEQIDNLLAPSTIEFAKTDDEKRLHAIVTEVLNVDPTRAGINQSFMNLGGDSISAMRLIAKCRSQGIKLSLKKLMSRASLSQLATLMSADAARKQAITQSVSDDIGKPFDLTPIQQHYVDLHAQCPPSDLDTEFTGRRRFHQSFFMKLTQTVSPSDVTVAVRGIVERHPMLQATFGQDLKGKWQQTVGRAPSAVDCIWVSDAHTLEEAYATLASANSLDVVNGPVFRAVFFSNDIEGQGQLLFLTAHHLVIDLVSWRILLEELEQSLRGQPLPELTGLSFQSWTKLQGDHARFTLDPRKALPFDPRASDLSYWGISGPAENTYGMTKTKTFNLSKDLTSLLIGQCHEVLRTDVVDVLLAAAFRAFSDIFKDRDSPTMFVEGHGREPWDETIDIGSTVGWFTALCPVNVSADPQCPLLGTLREVKDLRRSIPQNGWAYFASRYLNAEGQAAFQDDLTAEIIFNYAGQFQQLEGNNQLLVECGGELPRDASEVGPDTPRFALIEVSAVIRNGQLHMSFILNDRIKHIERLDAWVSSVQYTLEALVHSLCDQPQPSMPTLSDFPLVHTTHDKLDAQISEACARFGAPDWTEIEDMFPCSPLQTAMLLNSSMDAEQYRTCVIFNMISPVPISAEALSAGWTKVVAHHPSLRTVFIDTKASNGAFDQVIFKNLRPQINVLEAHDESALAALKDRAPADWSGGSPHVLTVIPTSAGVLCKLEISHALMDGASMDLLFGDLVAALEDTLADEPSPSYHGYIAYLQDKDPKDALAHWMSYLKGVTPCLVSPIKPGMESDETSEVPSIEVPIPDGTAQALDSFVNTHGVTHASVIQAAWAMVLRRYTQSEDISFGYAVAGRNLPLEGIEKTVGPFINVLPCRLDMSDDTMGIRNLADTVQRDFFESLPFQHTSLAEMQHELQLPTRALFDTVVSIQRFDDSAMSSPSGLQMNLLHSRDPTEFTLTLNAAYSADNLGFVVRYSPQNGVSSSRAESIAHTFQVALGALLSSPEQPLREADLLSGHDRTTIDRWNAHIPAAVDQCVPESIKLRAISQPRAPAVSAWDGELSYQELDEYTNRLAGHLMRKGVKAGTILPFCFERSLWTTVAILSILKSGAAFLPLNTNDPEERVRSLLQEADAHLVLTSPTQAPRFDGVIDTLVISESIVSSLPACSGDALPQLDPSSIAYILFTSGSTGKPKGVVIEHRSLASNIAEHAPGLGLNISTRALQFASYSFDASITETLATLVSGGCVCVPSEEEKTADIEGAMRRMRVNFSMLTPSVVQLLSPENLLFLKTLALVGEAVPKSLIVKWSEKLNLLVGYGPTETAVFASIGNLQGPNDAGLIGKAIGTQTWVVDPTNHNLLAPIGSLGELVLSGPALARGYLNSPDKTEAAFKSTPAWCTTTPCAIDRIYKTGDLVYYRDDGNLMYAGRKDGQVKIHGQRMEVGEVEHQILECLPAHSETAVAVLKSDTASVQRLVAFVSIPDIDKNLALSPQLANVSDNLRDTLSQLQRDLSERVSTYMIPSLYIPMASLPKSAAGKADRKAMLLLAGSLSQEQIDMYSLRGSGGKQVSTKAEKFVQGVWAVVLGAPIETISSDDHFFKLGGDSLSAMRVASNMRSENVSISVTELFSHPVLSALAALVETKTGAAQPVSEREVAPFELLSDKQCVMDKVKMMTGMLAHTVEDAYPATPLQEALIAITQTSDTAYVNRMAFQIPPDVDMVRFKQAWEAVYTVTPILRTALVNTELNGTCQVVFNRPLSWSEVDSSLASYMDKDSQTPISEGDVLTRYAIVHDGPANWFVWTAHHAAYDGWSAGMLFDLVQSAYETGAPARTPPYSNFIRYICNSNVNDSDEYWRAALDGYTRTDFPSIPHPDYRASSDQSVTHSIDLPVTRQNTDITQATVIRAAWALVVRKLSGSTDVVFGMTQNGRNTPVAGIEQIVGPCIATVPVRVRLDNPTTISKYLQEVQQQAADSIPYEQAGLQNIRTLSQGAEDACDFNNLLVIQPQSESESDPWLVPVSGELTKFDNFPLSIECAIGNEGHVELLAHLDSHLLSKFQVERILFQFSHVIRQLAEANTESLLSDVDFFTPEDRETICDQWNAVIPGTVEASLHDMFELNARECPDKQAIHSWDASLTYGELESLSTTLAYRLIDAGVKPGEIVPLCFEKSAWAVVSMLAVMNAGAAFVSIDPEHPENRRQDIVDQTNAKVMLASKTAPILSVGQTLVVSAETLSSFQTATETAQLPPKDPSRLAYIIFTSGSTGRSKGVMMSHRAVCSSAQMLDLDGIGFTRDSRVYQFPSYVFDASIYNIFATLTVGATLVVPSDEDKLGPNFAKSMRDAEVTLAIMTPTVSRLIQPEDVPTLRTLKLGGDSVFQEDVDKWASKVRMVQGYGPAEATVFVTWTETTPQSTPQNVGPARRARLWVVDPDNHDKLTPIGMVGEMLIEGPILADGYLNDEEKTTAAFITGPAWCDGVERRFYKTGDLVRYADDGSFLFIGRKDAQVKINGQRVELGEIENHLYNMLPSSQSITLVPKAGPCKNTLIALVAGTTSDSVKRFEFVEDSSAKESLRKAVTDVREAMPSRVPKYMVPRIWFAISRLPLTSSGKIDRKILQRWLEELDPDVARIEALSLKHDAAATIPTTNTESIVQQALGRVLNLTPEDIPLDKTFMALGGDSITGMQLVSRLQSSSIVLSVRQLLQSHTIRHLASLSQPEGQRAELADEVVGVPFDLSPIQTMLIDTICPDAMKPRRFNQSFLVRLNHEVDADKLRDALSYLVSRHSMLRARFEKKSDGCWIQTSMPHSTDACRISFHGTTSDLGQIMADSQSGLDIFHGPVFGADICTDLDGKQVIFMVAHHLAVDLVSWRIILSDLEEYLTTVNFTKRNKPLSFQTWLSLQQKKAEEIRPETALPFNPPQAPLDYWGALTEANTFSAVEEHSFSLSAELTSQLLTNCSQVLGTDTVDILIGALTHAFSHTFRDRDLPSIFTEYHGRESWDDSIDISSTVGWFTTLAPVHIASHHDDGVKPFVRKVKDCRRKTPMNGWSYFVSRFLNPEGRERFGQSGPMEITLNFVGQYQQLERAEGLFEMVPRDEFGSDTLDVSPDLERSSIFEISSGVMNGRLNLLMMWPRSLRNQGRIRQWLNSTERSLVEAIKDLQGHTRELTVSDFPLLSMADEEFISFVEDSLPKHHIAVGDVEDIYPATPLQEALMMSRSIDSELYTVHAIYKLSCNDRQAVDTEKLKAAWNSVVDRHQSLRTVFVAVVSDYNALNQVVLKKMPKTTVELTCDTDAQALEVLEKSKTLNTSLAWEVTAPAQLVICHATESSTTYCKIAINHAVGDGASNGILIRDMELAYESLLSADSGPLYSQYVAYIQSRDRQASLEYWGGYLSGLEPCMVNGDVRSGDIKELRDLELEIPHPDQLRAFSAARSVTLANVFQAAWALVLRNFAGTDQVCYGYLNAGRDSPVDGIRDAVGLFVNMLVSRVDFTDELTTGDLVKQVHNDYIDALDNQNCSLADMQRLAGQPLFNSIMSYQVASSAPKESSGSLNFNQVSAHDPTEYPLSLSVAVSDKSIFVTLSYYTDMVSDFQAQSMATSFEKALGGFTEATLDLPARNIPVLGDADISTIQQWNADVPKAVQGCIHQIFEDQVTAHPDAMAVCSTEISWTYSQLDELSTRLAHRLAILGIGPGTKVPYCFTASPWTVVVMMAILKSGGACVALDPKHPIDRLHSIIDDVDADIVITSSRHAPKFLPVAAVLALGPEEITRIGKTAPRRLSALPIAQPSDIAVVQFTSGSTGKPKGILLEHQSLCTSASYYGAAMGYGPGSRVIQFSSYTFDVSLSDIFFSLMRGGAVCVPTEDEKLNNLDDFINRLEVNTADMTPSVLEATLYPEAVPTLKTICLGGEAVKQDNLEVWADHVALHNYYGPSECSVACVGRSNLKSTDQAANIGVGCGALTWVVEASNASKLVPLGTVGELVLEGPVLAKGYLKMPNRTSEAFLDNVTWPGFNESKRLYRTGDLVRYNSDGTLTCLGRKDTQVKIRGQRVETGGIEHHASICCPPSITHLAVEAMTLPGRSGLALAMFVAVGSEPDACMETGFPPELHATLCSIKTGLAASLPSYMMPSIFVPLREIPLSLAGKRDRRALQDLVAALPTEMIRTFSLADDVATKREPSTAIERNLRGVWSKVLRVKETDIGVDDSFFKLGGDSISAMRLATAATKSGLQVSVLDILTHKTISKIAALAETKVDEAYATQSVTSSERSGETLGKSSFLDEMPAPFDPNEVEVILPTTSSQKELLQACKDSPSSGYYIISQIIEVLPQPAGGRMVDTELLHGAWQQVVDRHPALRTVFIDTTRQVILKHHIAKVSHIEVEEAEDLQTHQGHAPDWTELGPMHQVTIAKTPSGRVLCRMDIHHAITDGFSLMTMFEELASAYSGTLDFGPGPSLQDYVVQVEALDRKLSTAYWKTEMDAIQPRPFPLTKSIADTNTTARANLQELHSQINSDKLLDFCQANETTVPSLVYAAWGLVLQATCPTTYDDSNNQDTVFAYLSSARAIIPSEALGFLVNIVPQRVRAADLEAASLPRFVRDIHASVLEALPHSHVAPSELGLRISTLVNMRKFDDVDILAAFHGDDANDEQDSKDAAAGTGAKRQQQQQQHQITFEAFSSPDPMAVSSSHYFSSIFT